MTDITMTPQPLEGYSVLTNDQDPSIKAVAFLISGQQFAFPVNKALAKDLAKMFRKLAEDLPEELPRN